LPLVSKMEICNEDVFNGTLKFPSSTVIVGTSGCGKSELILDIIQNREICYGVKIPQVYYVYSIYQRKFEEFSQKNKDVYFYASYDEVPAPNGIPTLVIYDDQMSNIQSDLKLLQHIVEAFTKRRHSNISFLFTLQSLFGHGLKVIMNNATYTILFDNKRSRQEITYLSRQLFPGTGNFLQEAMRDVSRHPYQFLLIDSSPTTIDKFRVRNFIYCTPQSKIYTLKDD
jgi:hypothetical protein